MASSTTSKQAFLLLPALSLPLDKQSLRAAYKPTFETLLPSLSKQASGREVFRLDIGIVLSQPYATTDPASRTQTYPDFQKLIGDVYSLVCIVAAQQQIDLDIPGGLDVRLILLDSPTNPTSDHIPKPISGPFVNLETLVPSLSNSTTIYTVESERALSLASTLLHHYQLHHHSSPTIHHLPCGPSLTINTYPSPTQVSNPLPPLTPSKTHHSVAVGGTFDHLHIGHKLLLTFTIFVASPLPPTSPRKITIGITTDELLANKKHASVLESWDLRQQRTADFVESILAFGRERDVASMRKEEFIDNPGPNGKVVRVTYTPNPGSSATSRVEATESQIVINYTSISDPFGPTITDPDISALVISAETRAGGKAVNEKRREKGWEELEVFEVDVLDASPGDGEEDEAKEVREGFEGKISSTEIRRRMVEIEEKEKERAKGDRDGKL